MASRTFVDAVKRRSNPDSQELGKDLFFPQIYHENYLGDSSGKSYLKKSEIKDGKPAIFLSENEVIDLVDRFRFTLVGKFANRRPKIELIRKKFGDLRLSGGWHVGLLDGRHILIQLEKDEDYSYIFSLNHFAVENCQVKFLKWNVEFDYNREPSIAPVWINLPGLKLHMFHKEIRFSIAAIYGKPLKIDQPTFSISRPSIARILVEVDVTFDFPKSIWLGTLENGYWQKVEMENIPVHCVHCKMFGHHDENCYRLNPELKDSKGRRNNHANVIINSTGIIENSTKETEHGNIVEADLNNENIVNVAAQLEVIQDKFGSAGLDLINESIVVAINNALEESADLIINEGTGVEEVGLEGYDRCEVVAVRNNHLISRSRSLDSGNLLRDVKKESAAVDKEENLQNFNKVEGLLEKNGSSLHKEGSVPQRADSEPDTPVNIQYKQNNFKGVNNRKVKDTTDKLSSQDQESLEDVRKELEEEWSFQKSKKRMSGNKGKKSLEVLGLTKRITRRGFNSPSVLK